MLYWRNLECIHAFANYLITSMCVYTIEHFSTKPYIILRTLLKIINKKCCMIKCNKFVEIKKENLSCGGHGRLELIANHHRPDKP